MFCASKLSRASWPPTITTPAPHANFCAPPLQPRLGMRFAIPKTASILVTLLGARPPPFRSLSGRLGQHLAPSWHWTRATSRVDDSGLLCAVSGSVPEDPVASKDGYIFERRLIEKHVQVWRYALCQHRLCSSAAWRFRFCIVTKPASVAWTRFHCCLPDCCAGDGKASAHVR